LAGQDRRTSQRSAGGNNSPPNAEPTHSPSRLQSTAQQVASATLMNPCREKYLVRGREPSYPSKRQNRRGPRLPRLEPWRQPCSVCKKRGPTNSRRAAASKVHYLPGSSTKSGHRLIVSRCLAQAKQLLLPIRLSNPLSRR